MKKYVLFLAVPVIMAVMTSGSVWEGAAALGTNGELPDSGYYAASSSFPRNTVVDVTNLETRKTVRVIIAGPLESPGLLALLSRDAASSIGLSGRSVGRIRISQPADPVAFSRFTGESALSGDTDFDPRAAVAANYPHILGPVDAAGGQTQSRPDASAPYTGIVDLPPGGFIPAAAGSPDEGIRGEPVPESAWVYPEEIIGEDEAVPPVLAETALPENGYDLPEYTAPPGEPESGEETYEDIPEYAGTVYEAQPEISEAPPESVPPSGEIPEEILGEAPVESALGPSGITSEITLVPAEERPPEYAPEYNVEIPETPEIPLPDTPAPYVPGSMFSVPVISRLESGQYYLQLGAYSYTDSVEAELSRLGRTYPLSVQIAGGPDHPLYRVLIGPVNMGECGALLQRFKTTGYSDAFIRQEE